MDRIVADANRRYEDRVAIRIIEDMDIDVRRAAWSMARKSLRDMGYELGDMNMSASPADWSQNFRLRIIDIVRDAEIEIATRKEIESR